MGEGEDDTTLATEPKENKERCQRREKNRRRKNRRIAARKSFRAFLNGHAAAEEEIIFWNARGVRYQTEEAKALAAKRKAMAVMVTETQSYGIDHGDERWFWHKGKENLPVRGQTYPPGGQGCCTDTLSIPVARLLVW